ncbi:FtsX-like permease family protein [Actinomadura pelletieri DSM 43383]|uniref:FtsX-like permease family protein n=1 Tax=Actinomadura pelletieri DSM 43383 TaxID=1120940 RepID=A0A495QS99_9ACTN|nr:FtsX-like permease family protein [Actinomadura pelletieri]RKS76327.1 FtsX-like permease family protein [Actinomadura pelletieri DSM 43383]
MSAEHRSGRLLWLQLLKIGWMSGHGIRGSRLRFAGLVLASAALTMTFLSVVAAFAVYDGREQREQHRGPIVSEHSGDTIAFRWAESTDSLHGRQHWVISLEPASATAEPPPGLPRWPAPGEAFLSPGLIAAATADDHIEQRYGRFAGEIGESGLASPGERLVYLRPQAPPEGGNADELWYRATGFGQAWGIGEAVDPRPLTQVVLAIAALAGLPAVALLVVAARCGSATRDRRIRLLAALGARWKDNALVTIGEAATPAALGTILGAIPLTIAMSTNIRLPVTGYTMSAVDVRAHPFLVVAAALLSFLAVLLVVVALHRARTTGDSTRPRGFSERVPRYRLALFAVALSTVIISQYIRGQVGLFLFVVGTVGLWATLPSVGAKAGGWLGCGMAGLGNRLGNPGLIIGGRWTALHPGVIVRLATAMIISLGLISQLQVWQSRLGAPAEAAHATQARVGDQVLIVESRDITGERMNAFAGALPAGAEVLTVRKHEDESSSVRLHATCAALGRLHLECGAKNPTAIDDVSDIRMKELLGWYGGEKFSIEAGALPPPLPDGPETVAVVSDPATMGRDYRSNVEMAAYRSLNTPHISRLGDDWVLGNNDRARLGEWMLLFGIVGMVLLVFATVISVAGEFMRFGAALAPMAVLVSRPGLFSRIALWHLTIPMILSAATAAAITVWHSLFFISVIQEGRFSVTVLIGSVTGSVVFAIGVGILGGWSARQEAYRWRPTAD